MEKLYEELDELKAENEKLRVDCKRKSELSDNLKKAHNEQLVKIQEAGSKIEKQTQALLEKEEEISALRRSNEDLKSSFREKESTVKHLGAAYEKLRAESDEKNRNWEEERRRLALALDEENEKSIDQEQKINVLRAEMEGLKELLSVSQKKCSEAEKKVKNSKELRERDDVLLKLEEENRKVEDKLKWKMEQFKHLEEAHRKLRDQFKASQKEWEQEKSTLVDEICSLQTKLDSQISISKDLEHRLMLCNQSLAHEETRRKYLEVEVSDLRSRFENVYAECQDSKSQLERLTAQRDEDVATLRHTLGRKEAFYKEMEYRSAKLEQENQELLMSLKEAQEARIQEAGSASSLLKLRNKLRSVEQVHRECSKTLWAKEAEWNSQMEKLSEELDYSQSQLETRNAELEVVKKESEACLSSAMQLKLQNEELSVMLLVLKSGINDAQLQLVDMKGELGLHEKEREEKVLLLLQRLDMKNTVLAEAGGDLEKEHEKTSALLRRVESLEFMKEEHDLMQKELRRCKEMLKESSRCQHLSKQEAFQVESYSEEELRKACDALDLANSELAEEREKVASLSRRVQALELVEEKQILMQEELERHKNLLEEASRDRHCLEEQAFQIENQSKEKHQEVCSALDEAKSELAEEHEKVDSLVRRIESLEHVDEQLTAIQKELESYKEMYEESSRHQNELQEQLLQMEVDSEERFNDVFDALEQANSELAEEREKAQSLTRRVESLENTDEQLTAVQKELERYKETYEQSSRHQSELLDALEKANSELAEEREKADSLTRRVESLENTDERLTAMQQELERYKETYEESSRHQSELQDALEKANSALVEKTSEGHEIEFELWIWKSIAEQLKAGLEDNRVLRKELEASLLAEAQDRENIKKEKDDLVHTLEEKDSRISDLQQRVSQLEKELKAVSFSTMEIRTSFESEKESFFQTAREKDEILDDLSSEIDRLEQESLRRELLAAAFAHIGAERTLMQEKENLVQLLKKKDQKINGLVQAVKSLEENLLSSRESIARAEAKLEASDAVINQLRSEKGNLLEEVMNLSMEKENLFAFVGNMGDSISKLCSEDTQLTGMLGQMVQSCDVPGVVNGSHEVFAAVKENIHNIPSPKTKKLESFVEERSPFRQLN